MTIFLVLFNQSKSTWKLGLNAAYDIDKMPKQSHWQIRQQRNDTICDMQFTIDQKYLSSHIENILKQRRKWYAFCDSTRLFKQSDCQFKKMEEKICIFRQI
jgi:hypothetical protein